LFELGLVPYADMLNHKKPKDSSDTDTKWTFDDKLNGFTIVSLRAIQRGEQVYDSYGRKCNSRFFVNYGFSLDENEDDNEVVMKFSMDPSDPLYQMKLRMTGGRHLFTNREFQVPATYRETSDREKKTKELFSFLRFVHAVNSELLVLGNNPNNKDNNNSANEDRIKLDDIDPISCRNEIAVLKHIEQSAKEILAGFDTTLEQDNELLKINKFPDSNYRNCIVMRRGEKQVLHWYIELAHKCIPLLQSQWKDVKKMTAKSYQSNTSLDHYIVNVVVPLVKRNGGL
jgi:histone-lysine N-methyltransferase SETD3